jgi:Fic family protein
MIKWTWQQKNWPQFEFDLETLKAFEAQFINNAGLFSGVLKFTSDADKNSLKISLIGSEAYKTSEIEGEILDRESLQSSICRGFGLAVDSKKPAKKDAKLAEEGIAQMMSDLYRNFAKPLTHAQLFSWHKMLMNGRKNLKIGAYRTHADAMQVVSGKIHDPKIYFEAPPSKQIKSEMDQFIKWFNDSKNLPILTRAAITHLYFILIHPFEDGNGRIARALTIKALSQGINQSSLISLSWAIQSKKKKYYQALELSNQNLNIDYWLNYFCKTILEAQQYSQDLLELMITKNKLFETWRGHLNDRQIKVLQRIFKEEPQGFEGGLSAENYIKISKTSRATATRDLQNLLEMKILKKTGEGRWTRYFIKK